VISHRPAKCYPKLIYCYRNLTENNLTGEHKLIDNFCVLFMSHFSVLSQKIINEGISVKISINNNRKRCDVNV
jgi:hypothetical protein